MELDINNLIYQLLPQHKRLPSRMRWLTALLSPLTEKWEEFTAWRTDSRMLVNVNSQTEVLAGYLRAKFDSPERIGIESYNDELLWIPLTTDSEEHLVEFSRTDEEKGGAENLPEPLPYPAIPLRSEIRRKFGDVDFIVYIPMNVDPTLVAAEIDKYKQALIRYRIVQA